MQQKNQHAGRLIARFIRTGFKASTSISSNIGNFLTNFSSTHSLVGAGLVIDHQLTIGQLVAFQMLSNRVTGPLLRLVQLCKTSNKCCCL